MSDLISRQAVIDALADMHCKSDEDGYVWIVRSDAWARIDALPSAQPDLQPTCNQLATDCVSRQAAIEAISCDITIRGRQNAELVAATIGTFADRIKALPSAQPEIIRCRECKWKNQHNCTRAVEVWIDDDKYCAWAERRNDGVDS